MPLLNVMKNSEIFGRVMQDLVHEKSRDEGCTKTEIADGLGIAPQTLSGYLKGKHIPEYARLSVIAKYFGKSISFLLGEKIEAAAIENSTPQYGDDSHDFGALDKATIELLELIKPLSAEQKGKFLAMAKSMIPFLG